MTVSNHFSLLIITCVGLSGISLPAEAACSREDVEFYLSRGFTTSQITTICGEAGSENNKALPSRPASPPAQQQVLANSDELFLMEAIKARNVLLTQDALSYTLEVCIQYGEEDLYGFAPTACPIVRFKIAFSGLEVKQPKSRFFFKPDKIEVKGTIQREVLEGLEKYSPEEQRLILKNLESGDETAIPVRDDIAIDQIFQKLDELARK